MMRVVGFCALVCLLGCSGGPTPPAATDVTPDFTAVSTGPDAAGPPPSSKQREIGDVVSHMKLTAELDVRSNLPNIKNTETRTHLKDLAMVNIDVSQPIPEELWMMVWVKSAQNFPGSTVLVKGAIYVDDKEVETFEHVTGAGATRYPMFTPINVLAGYDEAPESMLVYATAKVSVFEGDESDFDPETAVAAPGSTSALESNPARITFIP